MSLVSFKILNSADQQFSAVLDKKRVVIRLRYNPTIDRWSFNLSLDGRVVIHGRRIVLGVDLLEPFNLDMGVLFSGHERPTTVTLEPGRKELIEGDVKLYHATEADLKEAASAPAVSS